jgi:hypothetical protein
LLEAEVDAAVGEGGLLEAVLRAHLGAVEASRSRSTGTATP